MKYQELFNKIDSIEERYLDILEEFCNIESPTDFKEGVDKAGEYILRLAKNLGFETEVFEQSISGNAACITLNSRASSNPVSLSGHLDTVHPVGLFGSPAVRRDENNMYGPGVMDCKGGIVAALMAMEALKECGFASRPVHLILQSDEENSSVTSEKKTIEYMCNKAKDSIAFLNLEGHKSPTAVTQRKGILRYKITVFGKALHSARCVEAANAVAEAAYKIIELEKMKDASGLTCNCGVIQGGSKPNTVAEQCEFYADIRFLNEEELNLAKQNVKEITDKTTIEGCSCRVEEVSYRPAMVKCKRNEELLKKMNDIYTECGLPVLDARLCLSGSDAAYVTESGIPCIDNLGTEGANIHSVDEYIELKSLAESAKRIACVIYCI